ncbi:kinesin-like protein KIN-13B isoform X2 [Carex rostrata]
MSGAAIRQMRSHQRQYSSEQLMFDPSTMTASSGGGGGGGGGSGVGGSGRWYSSSSQQGEYSRMIRGSNNRGFVTESWEPATPLQNNNNRSIIEDEFSTNELSPGLLDLHSFDTDLLPEIHALGDDSGVTFKYERDQMIDESEPTISTSKQTGKGLSTDKEKSNSVAKIRVAVRKRPLNKKEIAKREEDIISIHTNSLVVHETKLKVDLTEYMEKHEFVFDAVLDEGVSNDEVYRETVEPIVPAIFQRTKATCFAYGQTGNGKTYTMQPLPLKASQDIFRLMNYTYRNQGFHLFVSFFEIYGGKLFDLLGEKKKLCMREDGKQQVCIVGLQEFKVSNVETIKELIEKGSASRSTGMTGANEESSRSHAILQLVIKKTIEGKESKPPKVVGKLSFIDLAGSERGADTYDNDKQTRIEGAEINKSLLALKECIRALDNDQVHIPFRGSKLTEVLRDSFIGNSKTVMISCISPSSSSCEHTLNTLRYADRVKGLSKGSSKKDLSSSSSAANLRDPSPTPLPIIDYTSFDAPAESRKVWLKQNDRDAPVPTSSNTESRIPLSSTTRGSTPRRFNEYGYSEEINASQQDGRILSKRGSMNGHTAPPPYMDGVRIRGESPVKWRDVKSNELDAEDDLSSLLKEEEQLVMTHREQVEETINILREEMKLLEEADQPGNQLDEYISRLNVILSKKAAGIMNLQARLANFQRRLTENNVLVTPLGL